MIFYNLTISKSLIMIFSYVKKNIHQLKQF